MDYTWDVIIFGSDNATLCVGRDEKNIETVFNLDSFIQRVSIDAARDDEGFYDPNIVLKALINKIESRYV